MIFDHSEKIRNNDVYKNSIHYVTLAKLIKYHIVIIVF